MKGIYTSGDIKTNSDLIVGSTSNKWSPSGDINQAPSGIAYFGKQVQILGKNGLVLQKGSIAVEASGAYVAIGGGAGVGCKPGTSLCAQTCIQQPARLGWTCLV